jgi:hypothetical protein
MQHDHFVVITGMIGTQIHAGAAPCAKLGFLHLFVELLLPHDFHLHIALLRIAGICSFLFLL